MRRRLLNALLAVAPGALLRAQERVLPGTLAPKPTKPPVAPGTPAPKPVEPLAEGPVIRTTVNVVLVPTTVTDSKGAVINGLRPQDFELYDNEKRQEINRDVAFLPLSMVICIQRSANIEAILPKINKMGNVIHDLLVGQDGEVAIVSFDHRIETVQEFTNDPDLINEAVSKLRPGGQNSRLNDSIQHAIRMLRSRRDRRRVILLISETLDRSSEANVKEVATELQIHNVDVFTLNMSRLISRLTEKPQVPRPDPLPPGARPRPGMAAGDPTTQAQMMGTFGYGADLVPAIVEIFRATKAIFVKNPAEVYTQFTGGREYSFMTQADLEQAIARIGSEIRSQYILSYTPSNKIEGGFHAIKVVVNRPGLRVRTRPGYWMAAVVD
jgi:VWFA-related protein